MSLLASLKTGADPLIGTAVGKLGFDPATVQTKFDELLAGNASPPPTAANTEAVDQPNTTATVPPQ